ncbi:hypothetical protein KY289_035384 [Solanum tuberosum]|nr:hypothetical protein KY289_035384 [Solanum tuberosum]
MSALDLDLGVVGCKRNVTLHSISAHLPHRCTLISVGVPSEQEKEAWIGVWMASDNYINHWTRTISEKNTNGYGASKRSLYQDDIGNVVLSDQLANLARHAILFIRRTDAEQYISQGLMEELTS